MIMSPGLSSMTCERYSTSSPNLPQHRVGAGVLPQHAVDRGLHPQVVRIAGEIARHDRPAHRRVAGKVLHADRVVDAAALAPRTPPREVRGVVVGDHIACDVLLRALGLHAIGRPADDRGDLELEVELEHAVLAEDLVAVAAERGTRAHEHVGENPLVPGRIGLAGDPARPLEIVVGLEDVPRLRHRRHELHGIDRLPAFVRRRLEIEAAQPAVPAIPVRHEVAHQRRDRARRRMPRDDVRQARDLILDHDRRRRLAVVDHRSNAESDFGLSISHEYPAPFPVRFS